MTTKAVLKAVPVIRQPTLSFLGDLPLVTLAPLDRLHPATRARIDRVEQALGAADRLAASRLILAIEADMGITTADRISAAARKDEGWEGDIEAALASLGAGLERPVARPQPIAPSDSGLNEANIKSLNDADKLYADAERLIAKADANRNPARAKRAQTWRNEAKLKRRQARDKVIGVGKSVEGRAHTDYLEAALAETAELETARGEDVERTVTGMRITSRDGLESLALNPIQKAAAQWYRDLYERTQRGARVASYGDRPMGDMKDRKASDWGLDQITRKAVEAKVMAASRNGRGITALRLAAGEGRTINSISGGKSQNRKLNTEALIVALDVVADHRGMQ